MFNKFMLCLASILFLSACGQNEVQLTVQEKSEIREAVHQTFRDFVEATKLLDPDSYFEYFDEEKFTSLNADGTVSHSIKELDNIIRSAFPVVKEIQSLEFSKVKVTVLNSTTAILVNEYADSTLLKDGALISGAGAGSQVWSKLNGRWKLVSVSSSEKPRVSAH